MLVGGIDAGGSSTRCIIYDTAKKRVLTKTKSGPGNYQIVGLKKAINEINIAFLKARENIPCGNIETLGLGIAGAGRKVDKNKLKIKLIDKLPVSELYITDDGEIALLGATGGKKGVILIAGTGSIAYGLKKDKQKIRRGGWGPIIGDEGSGYWLGMEAIRAGVKFSEGRGPATELLQIVKEKLDLTNLNELIPMVYDKKLPRKKIAKIAPSLIDQAGENDEVSKKILENGIDELIKMVLALVDDMDYKVNKFAVSGGLFQNKNFIKFFSNKLKNTGFDIYHPKNKPVMGAVYYALRQKEDK
ncbi:MAG: N-acetylglucosamine kinase [Halanaerobiales bacterium]